MAGQIAEPLRPAIEQVFHRSAVPNRFMFNKMKYKDVHRQEEADANQCLQQLGRSSWLPR